MTVSYSSEVFTCKATGIFLRLLFRWRGSIYKLVWCDLLVYIGLYSLFSIIYRFFLDEKAKTTFENLSLYCANFANLIPVTFILGFYVSLVITRWWSQFESLPWPDSASVWITTCIHGHDDRGRLMRRNIIRYLNLTLILTLRLICLPVRKRFLTMDHLVEAGILMEEEKKIMEKLDDSVKQPKYWIPIIWAGAIVTRARKENRIKDDYSLKAVIEELDKYRSKASTLLDYDWITVPLVYTQVVTLAVYSFLLSTLMGRQFLDPSKKHLGHEVDLVVPVFTFLQFFFYMGWLKVAEALINPFGEDDDDFDMNWLIDRNLQVSYLIVDEMHSEHPPMVRDQFWDDIFPELPYTAATEESRIDPDIGAATQIDICEVEAEFLPLLEEDVLSAQIRSRSQSRNRRMSSSTLGMKDLEEAESGLSKPEEESSNSMMSFIQTITSSIGQAASDKLGSPLGILSSKRSHRSFAKRMRRAQRLSGRSSRSYLSPNGGGTDGDSTKTGEDRTSNLSFDSRIYPPSEDDEDDKSVVSRASQASHDTNRGTLPQDQLQAKMVSVLESIKEYLEMEKCARSQDGSLKGSKSLDTLYEEDSNNKEDLLVVSDKPLQKKNEEGSSASLNTGDCSSHESTN